MATATAVLDIGAVPVFADIDPHTYTLDPASAAAGVIHVRGRSSRCIWEAVRLIWTPSWPEHSDTISSLWKTRPKPGGSRLARTQGGDPGPYQRLHSASNPRRISRLAQGVSCGPTRRQVLLCPARAAIVGAGKTAHGTRTMLEKGMTASVHSTGPSCGPRCGAILSSFSDDRRMRGILSARSRNVRAL